MNRIVFLLLLLLPFYSYSQSKIEIEKRIQKSEVPLLAQKFIDSLHFTSKVKWFVEQDTRKTFEAKINQKGKKYSIEFDSLGQIEDIELVIKWNQIPPSTQNAICEKLNVDFEKFKIKKIQIQYSGKEIDLLNFEANTKNLISRYEIVLKGQKQSKTSSYEYLFSEKGEVEEERLVEFRNTDNIEY